VKRTSSSDLVKHRTEVAFGIELRPATSAQLEAGKRLFSRLLARAQSSIEASKEQEKTDSKT
jgi:hypothetical protein